MSDSKRYKIIETQYVMNSKLFANIIYNNFVYLSNVPELMHTVNDINNILHADGNMCYLVYDNSILIGYLVGIFRDLPDGRYGYYISYLYVCERYRKQGIGKLLMDLIIKKCRDNGTRCIVLTCDTYDGNLVNFYKKFGFAIDKSLNMGNHHKVFSLEIR